MYNTSTKAWKITEDNTGILKNISSVDEDTFKQNIGWVLVEDWSERPRFLLLPERIFHDYYPNLELTLLSIDDHPPLYSRETLEQLLEKATLLGFTDDVAHWKSELAKI